MGRGSFGFIGGTFISVEAIFSSPYIVLFNRHFLVDSFFGRGPPQGRVHFENNSFICVARNMPDMAFIGTSDYVDARPLGWSLGFDVAGDSGGCDGEHTSDCMGRVFVLKMKFLEGARFWICLVGGM